MHLKTVFAQPFAYAVCALKLVVYPLFAFLCVKFLPFFGKGTDGGSEEHDAVLPL